MNKLTIQEKLDIVNSGGEIDCSNEYGNWIGTKIRKTNKIGKVITDMNGVFRKLTVRFTDGIEEIIRLNNIGNDPTSVHQYEWYCKQAKRWYRF